MRRVCPARAGLKPAPTDHTLRVCPFPLVCATHCLAPTNTDAARDLVGAGFNPALYRQPLSPMHCGADDLIKFDAPRLPCEGGFETRPYRGKPCVCPRGCS